MDPSEREWTWRAHPARERPLAAVLAILAVGALSISSGLFLGHLAVALPAAVVLLLSLNRFLFPSSFHLDGAGIEGRYPLGRQRLSWTEVRRLASDERGLWLSTRSRPSRMDAWQGMHVLFGGCRQQVTTRIRACLKAAQPS